MCVRPKLKNVNIVIYDEILAYSGIAACMQQGLLTYV